MKTLALLILNISLVSCSYCQTHEGQDSYNKLDTVKTYNIRSLAYCCQCLTHYSLNDAPIDKITYKKYKRYLDNETNCKPCYLKTYDLDENLIMEGVRYQDCEVGSYIYYYPNGKKKEEGHFKENHSGNWNDIVLRGYCTEYDGTIIFYDITGNIIRKQFCKDGKCTDVGYSGQTDPYFSD